MLKPPKIISIQILRALACLLVLQAHFFLKFPVKHVIFLGSIGLDLFFVISGYIIASNIDRTYFKASRGKNFLINRFCRVVPYYYLMTIVFTICLFFLHYPIDISNFIKSFLFFPQKKDPIIFLGWSLNHEIYFYLVCGLVIMIIPKIKTEYVGIFFFLILILSQFINSSNYLVLFLNSNINFIFLLGFYSYVWREMFKKIFCNYFVFFFSAILFFSAIFFSTDFPVSENQNKIIPLVQYSREWIFIYRMPIMVPRCFAWGLPSFLLFNSFISIEKQLKTISNSWLVKIGDASFSIYLVQAFLWLLRNNLRIPSNMIYSIGLSFSVIIISLFIYKFESKIAVSVKCFFKNDKSSNI